MANYWTGKEKISVTKTILFLNGLLKEDPKFVNSIFLTYYKCNRKTLHHKTVQVSCYGDHSKKSPACRLIGLLNGLFGIKDGWGAITMIIDNGKIVKFKLVGKTARKKWGI